MKKQHGFAGLEGILILVIAGLIGFVGWYVWHSKAQTDKTLGQATQSSQSSPKYAKKASPSTSTPSKTLAKSKYDGWATYHAKLGGFDIKYPTNWKLTQNNSAALSHSDPDEVLEVTSPSGSKLLYSYSQYEKDWLGEPNDYYGCGHQSACQTFYINSVSKINSGSRFGYMYIVRQGTNKPMNSFDAEGYMLTLYKPIVQANLAKTGNTSFSDKAYSFVFINSSKDSYGISVTLPGSMKAQSSESVFASDEAKTANQILESFTSS